MFAPGFITASQAKALRETQAMTEANDRQFRTLARPIDDFFPAKVTNGSAGLHAWTEQTFDTNSARYTKPDGRAGIVNGVDGATATWMPAHMPDGSTLTSFPQYVWLKRTVSTSRQCPEYEILVAAGGVGDPADVTLSGNVSLTGSQQTLVTITLPSTGLYQIIGTVTLQATLTYSGSFATGVLLAQGSYAPGTGMTLYGSVAHTIGPIVTTPALGSPNVIVGGTSFPSIFASVTGPGFGIEYHAQLTSTLGVVSATILGDGVGNNVSSRWAYLKLK